MIYLVAVLLPWLALMVRGKVMQGLLCLVLQITVLGWIPAAIWAVLVINNQNAERRHREMMSVFPPRNG